MRRRMQLTLSAEVPLLSVICFVRPAAPPARHLCRKLSLTPRRRSVLCKRSARFVESSPAALQPYGLMPKHRCLMEETPWVWPRPGS